MKKLFVVLSLAGYMSSHLHAATVVWTGSNPVSVVDTNVILKKDITLQQGLTTISAVNQDITVRLDHSPEIRNNPVGSSTLNLDASSGRTITVKVKKDSLTFKSKNGFFVSFTWSGNGTIRVVEEQE